MSVRHNANSNQRYIRTHTNTLVTNYQKSLTELISLIRLALIKVSKIIFRFDWCIFFWGEVGSRMQNRIRILSKRSIFYCQSHFDYSTQIGLKPYFAHRFDSIRFDLIHSCVFPSNCSIQIYNTTANANIGPTTITTDILLKF